MAIERRANNIIEELSGLTTVDQLITYFGENKSNIAWAIKDFIYDSEFSPNFLNIVAKLLPGNTRMVFESKGRPAFAIISSMIPQADNLIMYKFYSVDETEQASSAAKTLAVRNFTSPDSAIALLQFLAMTGLEDVSLRFFTREDWKEVEKQMNSNAEV